MDRFDANEAAPPQTPGAPRDARGVVRRRLGRVWRRVRQWALASRWGIAAFVVTLIAFSAMFDISPNAHDPGNSDGHYNWLFARSLAYDGDLDFANDYRLCGDPFHLARTSSSGRVTNGYYIGPAVFWTPVAWVAKKVIRLPPQAPELWTAGCEGPRAKAGLWATVVLGAATVWLLYRIARRFAGDGVAAMIALLMSWTGSLIEYSTIQPSYGHVHEAFAASLVLLATLRAAEARKRVALFWLAAGLAVGLAILQKPTLGCFLAVPGVVLVARLRARPLALVASLAMLALGVTLSGVGPLLALNKYLFGAFTLTGSKPPYYVQLGHAHPLLLLFAPRGGLFYWMPIAWLAVLGIPLAFRDRKLRAVALGGLVTAIVIVYLSAAVLDWEASSSFGARRLTPLIPLLAMWGAIAAERARVWLAMGKRMTVALGLCVLVPFLWTFGGASIGLSLGKTSTERDRAPRQEELYGDGAAASWMLVDRYVGDIAVFPAALVYAARYRRPITTFRDATSLMGYSRDTNTMAPPSGLPGLTDERMVRLALGAKPVGDAVVIEPHASFVFAVRWPFATELALDVEADTPVELRAGSGRALRAPLWYGSVHVDGGKRATYRIPIPPGGFDSGVNEIVLEYDGPADANVRVRSLQPGDTTVYPPPR